MPTVTSLRGAVRDPHRINVFLNGKFSFSLTLTELADSKLHQGQVLTDPEVERLRNLSGLGKLYQQTLEYCFSRPHSKKEIIDYLERKRLRRDISWKRFEEHQLKMQNDPEYAARVKEIRQHTKDQNQKIREIDFTENNTYEYRGTKKTNLPTKPADRITSEMIQEVVSRLESQNYINDQDFARYFIENRHQNKGISTKRLIQELKIKGIDSDIIEQAMFDQGTGNLFRDEEVEIEKMIKKQLRKTSDRQKIIAYLARQGFSYDLIKTKLDQFLSAEEESTEEEYF
ncbi:MAG: RecX family transcriptional regulator [Candidatus Nanosynbacter sp.]|nr:RecX family transcriptional regulator [Candidatus Nanosynbacter sp.]